MLDQLDQKVEFLYLDESDMIEAGVLDMKRCVSVMDEMFELLGKGDYLLGGPKGNEHGQKLWFPKESPFPNMPLAGPERRFMAMLAYVGGRFNICGEKWYGSNVANPPRGLPRSILMVMLNDPDTCVPLTLMSANLLSASRTGAVPGVAAKHLARKGAKKAAFIGAGPINKAIAMAIKAAVPAIEEIAVYDLLPEKSEAFLAELGPMLGLRTKAAKSTEEAVSDADIISSAAAGPVSPKIETPWLKPGSLLAMTNKARLDSDFLQSATIIADNWKLHQAYIEDAKELGGDIRERFNSFLTGDVLREIYDGGIKESDIRNLGDIMIGKEPGRRSDDERIVFIASGMPCEDVAWGYDLYLTAKEKGLGQTLKIWDKPHWM